MNRILLYSFLIFLFYNNYAQDYIPFPTTNAVWTIGGWGVPDDGGYYKYAYVMDGDTIINDMELKKIWLYNPHKDGTYSIYFEAGIIEEDRRIYFTTKEYNTSLNFCGGYMSEDTIILLYDFHVNVGDTIHYFDAVECWDDIVEDIGSEFYYDLNRKYYQMAKYSGNDHKVYEGIGSTCGPFYPIMGYGEAGPGSLICFEQNMENWEESECIKMLYTNIREHRLRPVETYPNPVSTNIYFKLPEHTDYNSLYISVFNITGQYVLEKNLASDNSVETGHLEQGVYFYRLFYGQKLLQTGKFVKE